MGATEGTPRCRRPRMSTVVGLGCILVLSPYIYSELAIHAPGWLSAETVDTHHGDRGRDLLRGTTASAGNPSSGQPGGWSNPGAEVDSKTWDQAARSSRKLAGTHAAGTPRAPSAWTLSVGPEQVLHTNASKPWRFPDGNIGLVTNPRGSSQPYTFFAAGQGIVVRTQGTLNVPSKSWKGSGVWIKVSGLPADVRYAGGGPVYQYARNKWVIFCHYEYWRNGTKNSMFRSSVALIKSTDQGLTWSHVGEILRIPAGYAQPIASIQNMAGAHYVARNVSGTDYFYVYFRDLLANGTPVPFAVARAPVAAVETWIDGGAPARFLKYFNGEFTEDGLTGDSSYIGPPGMSTGGYFDVKWNAYLQKYLAVIPMGTAWPDIDFFMDESADGLVWSNRRTIFGTPSRMETYPTMIGLDGDPNTLGRSFYLYYQASDTMNRTTDDKLARRTLTIGRDSAVSLDGRS